MSRGWTHGLQTYSGWGRAARAAQRAEPREQGTLRLTGRTAPLPPAEVVYGGQQGRKTTPGPASLYPCAGQRICPYPAGHHGHK